jgi:hypothetical protein
LLAVVVIVIIAVVAILATPVVLAGGSFNVPVTKITFNEATDGGLKFPTTPGGANGDYWTTTNSTAQTSVYTYYYSQRTQPWFQTTENKVNASAGSVNMNFTFHLSTPSGGQDLPMQQLTGVALGNRTHTVYLSVDQGVKDPGTYTLTVTVNYSIKEAGQTSYSASKSTGFSVTWKI